MTDRKQYLGDGVYADFDGTQVILTTEDGISVLNIIYLDAQVMGALVNYYQRCCTEKRS